MNKQLAARLAKRIDKTDGYRVTGIRCYGHGDYALDVVITESGDRIVINNSEQWGTRLRNAGETPCTDKQYSAPYYDYYYTDTYPTIRY